MSREADKRASLREALAGVPSGARVALGGMTLYRRPVAAALAMASSGLRDLDVVAFTGGLETDLLVGAGCVRSVRSCYVGLEIAGPAPHFTRAVEAGAVRVVEESEYTLSHAVQAGAMKVPFLPAPGTLLQTDLLKVRPDLRVFRCPVTDQTLVAVPALQVDLAVIHAPAADRRGNCNLQGQLALDRHLPLIASRTVVTTERVVETDELLTMPGGVQIPGFVVDHVVHVRQGSRPTSCFPCYELDMPAIAAYAQAAREPRAWAGWLEAALAAVALAEEDGAGAGRS